MPPFFTGPQFPLAEASRSEKKLKISSKDRGGIFRLVFISGLGIEIGLRQPEPQRKPKLSSFANPAVPCARVVCCATLLEGEDSSINDFFSSNDSREVFFDF